MILLPLRRKCLIAIITGLLGTVKGDNTGTLDNLENSINTKYVNFQTFKESSVNNTFISKVNDYCREDVRSHDRVKGTRTALMPEGGECGLHWSLCPNMCSLDTLLPNYFADIRGNKMQQYRNWHIQIDSQMRSIIKDMDSKLGEVDDLEQHIAKNSLDLEIKEKLFISQLDEHIARAMNIREDLTKLKYDYSDMENEVNDLQNTIEAAHTDCYEQAPCLAVPDCKLGVASGKSCADIARNAMDLDPQGEATLNTESAVHLIKPTDGLSAVPAICEFDYTGTAFTVVQHRHNDTGTFNGDFENGFGTTLDYDDATCGESNYYLGNKYIRAIAATDSVVKVNHPNGVDQWNHASIRADTWNLNSNEHLCGDSISSNEILLGPGGINGQWQGQTKIMIGKDNSHGMNLKCMWDYDTVYPTDTSYNYKNYY